MAGLTQPFNPAGTVTIAVSSTSTAANLPAAGDTALIYNATSAVAFVAFGAGAVTASDASFPIPPGARALIGIGDYATGVAAILSTGTGNIYVSRGVGDAY